MWSIDLFGCEWLSLRRLLNRIVDFAAIGIGIFILADKLAGVIRHFRLGPGG
jgi:hypothetical protein